MRRTKAEGTNLLKYRVFDGKVYGFFIEYPKFHSEVMKDAEKLRKKGYLVRTIPTAYGFALYKRKK